MEISAKVFMKDIVPWQHFPRSENINSSQKRHTTEGKASSYNALVPFVAHLKCVEIVDLRQKKIIIMKKSEY